MDAGAARGRDDVHRIGIGLEARDVLSDCSGEQRDVLRQVADVAAERVGLPLRERSAVEPDGAARRLPRADQRARERRLAGAARPDQAECRSGAEREADTSMQRRRGGARRRDGERSHAQRF